jgi:hypothetical protein
MYRLLTFAILAATLREFGGSVRMLSECCDLNCVRVVLSLSRDAAEVKWKPIVIFPTEAAQYK